ncbi:hypothetical protein GJ744_004845 [Endocarpon pusillum]|uniref:DUF6594 domain-containing protein n=1 Tax=Endocarpon pusillum TaxID=364733 RepID=A0A8H7AUC6_9EURO|nr:hypothetical protein GJ744_004845 [Endocarpon pusillum]
MPGLSDLEQDGMKITYLASYASLAKFVSSDPDHSTAIFKTFDRLAARNLLYLQSELAEFQAQQDRYDEDDLKAGITSHDWHKLRQSSRDWNALVENSKNDGRLRSRVQLAYKIRKKIKEYHEAMMLESAILSLRKPSKQTHKAFRNTFNNLGSSQDPLPCLGSSNETLYDDRNDLAALRRAPEEDRLTVFLRTCCSLLFSRRSNCNSSLGYGSERLISFVVSAITVLLAASFLFGAIYALYAIQRDRVKLGVIAGFTIAFALCIALVTNARRSEIFGASAAYAAVLVVFVSGSLNDGMPGITP